MLAPRLVALLLAAVASLPAGAQTSQPSLADLARRSTAVAAPASPGRHLIWRVSKDGRTLAWLVGSIHVLSKAEYPLPPLFDTVYASTKVLVEEVDLDESADAATVGGIVGRAMLADGQTLKTLLDAPTYARVAEKAAAVRLPMMLLERMKPWLVAMTLMVPELQRAGFDPAHGLDRHFYNRARSDGRPIRGLETAAYQLDRMNGLPMPAQLELLTTTLDDVDTQVKNVGVLVDGWKRGDTATLERLMLKELQDSPEVYERLLVERNRNWVPLIAQCEPTAPCMVVVGGAHLLGPDSVVALLGQAGFTVEQQ
jgi:uncharacterized protein YbaP (TraB family)